MSFNLNQAKQQIDLAFEDWLAKAKASPKIKIGFAYCADLRAGPLKSYMRLSERMINGVRTPTISIATIDVDERHQKRGLFTHLLERIEHAAEQDNRAIFVEQILNPHLESFLKRRGYICPGNWEMDLARVASHMQKESA